MHRPSLLLLLGSLSACPPVPLDPIVTDSGLTTGGPTSGEPGATDGMSGPVDPTTGPTTTPSVDDPLPSTGPTADDTTGPAVTISTSDATNTTDTPNTTTTTGDSEDTVAPRLDPCPMTGPMLVDVSGSSPSGTFTAVQGVFAWQQGGDSMLNVYLMGTPVDTPHDFYSTETDRLALSLKSFAGVEPRFWIGQEIFANVTHHKTFDQYSQLDGITIPIDAMTLEVWSGVWEDYDNEPILGGHFSLQQPGWDMEGVFEVPYCHELSVTIPI